LAKEVVKQLRADLSDQSMIRKSGNRFSEKIMLKQEGEAFREERAMADKPEFVDMISEAPRQTRRRYAPRVVKPAAKETSRLSHWPPDRWVQWRMETLTPWKLKSWKFKNWD
jgi:hypothetical protein